MDLPYKIINNKILNEKFTNVLRSSYVDIKNTTMPIRILDFAKEIENFTVHNDDIWICSFPKTGTTWTQEMIWMIMNDLNFEEAKVGLGERFPFLDYTILFDYRKLMENNKEFKPPGFLTDSVGYVESKERPRFIKTHLPWHLLPEEIRDGSKNPKIICVSRNPKDVCVSYYHHCRLIEGFTGNFDEFCQLFFDGKLCYAPYWINVMPFWEKEGNSNILLLKYEDLKKDLKASIKKVAEFLGKNLTDSQVCQLSEHLSFSNMKNNDAVNYQALLDFNKKFNLSNVEGSFMRSGSTDSYKAEMPSSLVEKFDSWIKLHDPENKLGYQ